MTGQVDKDSSWNQIQDLSSTMQQYAAVADWQAVATAATARHQLVSQHFERFPVGPGTAEYYYTRLNDFLANEHELQHLAKIARKKIMQHGVDMQQGKKARLAYLDSKQNTTQNF